MWEVTLPLLAAHREGCWAEHRPWNPSLQSTPHWSTEQASPSQPYAAPGKSAPQALPALWPPWSPYPSICSVLPPERCPQQCLHLLFRAKLFMTVEDGKADLRGG